MELTVKSKRVNFQKLKAKVKKLSSIWVTVVQIDSYAKIRKIETFSRTNLMVTAAWVSILMVFGLYVYTKVCKGKRKSHKLQKIKFTLMHYLIKEYLLLLGGFSLPFSWLYRKWWRWVLSKLNMNICKCIKVMKKRLKQKKKSNVKVATLTLVLCQKVRPQSSVILSFKKWIGIEFATKLQNSPSKNCSILALFS